MTQYEIQGKSYTLSAITPMRLAKAFQLIGIKTFREFGSNQSEIGMALAESYLDPAKISEMLKVAIVEDVSDIDVQNIDVMTFRRVWDDFFYQFIPTSAMQQDS